MQAQQSLQPAAGQFAALALKLLGGGVEQTSLTYHSGRAADGPWADLVGQQFKQLKFRQNKAKADTGQTKELAERTQHNQPGTPALGRQAQIWRVVHEGLVHHQPASARGQSCVPLQQPLGSQAQAGRVIGVNHHQHIQRIEIEIDFLLHDLAHDVPATAPRLGVLGVAGRQHTDLARTPQARQQLNGALRTRHRQHVRCPVVSASCVLKPVVGFRQARPGPLINRRNRKRPGRQATGQVQPVRLGNAVVQNRLT